MAINTIIQNTLVIITVGAAVFYLLKKYIYKPKKTKSKSACGTNNCGCN